MISAEPEVLEKLSDPVEAADAVGLNYVTDDMPGIRREPAGKSFRYRHATGEIVKDPKSLGRIKSLAIPPAWTDVWICADPNGHLQATGRDARRRKQHRYHPRWREIRDETKYARMLAFARALPKIRKRVDRDLRPPGLPRNKVLATVVRLLEVSLIRVGNEEYAKENNSFGLTTMKNRHVDISGSTIRFHFRGKSGKMHEVDIRDPRLARIVRDCQALPGQELFQYVDENGERQNVKSGDVNNYLREITGEYFTAKDFRTWAGTVLAAIALKEFEKFDSQAQAKKNLVQAIERVAERLGNTPAVCRKCYIHPNVIDSYMDGTLIETLKDRAEAQLKGYLGKLRSEEAAVVGLLQQRLTLEQQLARSLKKQKSARSQATSKKASRPQAAPRQ